MPDQRRVCLLIPFDLPRWEAEDHPSRWPYGLEALAETDGLEVFAPRHAGSAKVAPTRLERLLEPVHLVDRTLRPSLTLPVAAMKADVLLAIFEQQARPYARLAPFRSLPPLVVMSCWLAQSALSPRGLEAARSLARSAAALTVFSDNQVPIVASAFGISPSLIYPVTFGVEVDYYTPAGEDQGYVAVVGNDVGRDWPTLVAAAGLTPEVEYRVATSRGFLAHLEVPPNVTMLGSLAHGHYRQLLRHAAVVAVPSHPLAYPTGQSVLLEGYACGRPGLAAKNPAMRAYALPEASLTYEPGEPASLAAAVRALLGSPARRAEMGEAARQAAERHFDSRRMWAHLAEILVALPP